MAEIKEVFEDIKDTLGDKGFLIFIGACVLLFIVNLKRSDSNYNEMTTVTGVTSYPDSVTNANVIMDTINDSITYSEQEIIEAMGERFEATNDYINKGLEANKEMAEKIGSIENSVETGVNISAMTYYEQMRDLHGKKAKVNSQALGALENAGFDTSKEFGTNKDGTPNEKAGSKGGGWTTFVGKNTK